MQTFKIDAQTNDLLFDGQNNIVMVENIEEQKQSLNRLLSTSTNEYFLNVLFGLNYSFIEVKNPDIQRIRAEIIKSLSQESRIKTIDTLTVNFDRSSRNLEIGFKITMIDGNIVTGNEVIDI